MRRSPFSLGASLMGVAMAGLVMAGSAAASTSASSEALGGELISLRRRKRPTIRHGKHTGRRNDAKLRANRLHVSKRVRRKHRKAARHG